MTPCAAAIATVITGLPGAASEHVDVTATAISIAAPTRDRAARLIAIGYSESRFLPRIQLGDCRKYVVRGQMFHECDAGRARSYWQMHQMPIVPEWTELLGLDDETVERAARAADRILQRGMRSCRTEEGAASYYARGQCRWGGGKKRALLAKSIQTRLTACQE